MTPYPISSRVVLEFRALKMTATLSPRSFELRLQREGRKKMRVRLGCNQIVLSPHAHSMERRERFALSTSARIAPARGPKWLFPNLVT